MTLVADEAASGYEAVSLALRIEDAERVVVVVAVFDGDELVLTVDGDDLGADGPLRTPAAGWTLQIASLVGLGPRPVPAGDPVVLMSDDEGLTAGRAALLEGWSEEQIEGTALQAGGDLIFWTVLAAWPLASGETAARALVVLDGGDDGLATLEERDGAVAIVPRSSTDVWTQLSGLLPRPFELV